MAANPRMEAVDRARELLGLPDKYMKDYQKNAIIGLLHGKDTFVAQPTGAGKSLVYQLLPLASDFLANPDKAIEVTTRDDGLEVFSVKSVVIIVSPLISLIQDQVKDFSKKKLHCLTLPSGRFSLSKASYIFTSPEALLECIHTHIRNDEEFQSRLCAVVVDESHCIVKW